jgi:hypothetical protein
MSLRALMLLIAVVAGWLGWICHRARVLREAVTAIESAGGTVYYDWEWKDGLPMTEEPGWLRRRLGPGFFEEVARTSIGEKGDDALMVHIGRLRHLQSLGICRGNVTHSGLAAIAGLTNLKQLDISHTGITDAGLARVADLTNLETLSLDNTSITDAELARVAGLTNLEVLSIENTRITDGGLIHLTGLKRCHTICVSGTKVTPKGVTAMRAKCPWMTIYRYW